ncbi:hypothetical protein IP70_03430 [alpha proteobacterium AAP38]|uniref:TetR/AcrR family transcriptional regulator n=1 Tax=Niveispirillum cyanobacteriorum TaxID=1612173 RepID=A0A2K9NGU1_9PROT|nr:TetR/AcrR family transcriptional regulator [Niveispirillum cyanobacteriorum]AUN32272.1 TetR/AcrR family transcriptional regulator [Niveispirillum cyanobacteriorum]KPF87264.1 hypothetical protein IP70_03430 [alpha proteobacterium AAP38]GGE75845.1 TetR family transcriptional regulator [Niveispirillum cyanobacteriorum]
MNAPAPKSKSATPARNPRAAEADETKANILAVARREFADKGLMGARIDEIAEKTDTSKRMIYYHFGSKEGLYQAVLEQEYIAIRDSEAALPILDVGAEEALKAHIRLTFDHHFKNPEFVRLVMNENILHGSFIGNVDGIKRRSQHVIQGLKAILDKGVAEGLFRADIDPVELHMTISALSFYNVSNRYTFSTIFGYELGSEEAAARRKEQVVEIVMTWCRKG